MNLVSFSIKTKGLHNFARRLWTVFTRFGISEARIRRALHAVIDALHEYDGAPTFFIPAIVLSRHIALIKEIANLGAEIGIHGYVHNDYRFLSEAEQYKQQNELSQYFGKRELPMKDFVTLTLDGQKNRSASSPRSVLTMIVMKPYYMMLLVLTTSHHS